MTKAFGLANTLMLTPLIGVSDTLPKALSFLGLSVLVVTLYGLVMAGVRSRLSAPLRLIASLMLAATLVSVVQLLLQAFALTTYQQLGLYLAMISVQCVVLEHGGFFAAGQLVEVAIAHAEASGAMKRRSLSASLARTTCSRFRPSSLHSSRR